MKYHLVFRNFNSATVRCTKELLEGWSSKSEVDQWLAMDSWTQKVSEIYGFQKPVIQISQRTDNGYYHLTRNEIVMVKPSVITLLHEFRHAMQTHLGIVIHHDLEFDARAWSLSLYWQVAPRTLKRLVRAGKVLHTTAEDFRG